MERRGIPREMLERVLASPQQIVVEREGKEAYQSQIDFGGGRMHLLRAIVNDALDPAVVGTFTAPVTHKSIGGANESYLRPGS